MTVAISFNGFRRKKYSNQDCADDIGSDKFEAEEYFEQVCFDAGHGLIKINNHLVCIYCDATTENYPLLRESEKCIAFLTACAKDKGILLDDATEKDLPLIEVLKARNYYRRYRNLPSKDTKKSYPHFKEDTFEIGLTIKRAHILDEKKYLEGEISSSKTGIRHIVVKGEKNDDIGVIDPRYLSGKRLDYFQKKLDMKLSKIEQSNSTDRAYLLEEYLIMKYEISILKGKSIPELLASTTNELEKIALTKAYVNLSSQMGRENSGYFESEYDAKWYNCITACPEINQKILEIGLIRK